MVVPQPVSPPKIVRQIPVTASSYSVSLVALVYADHTWQLAIEFHYRGQSGPAPLRFRVPETDARRIFQASAVSSLPYFNPPTGEE